MIDMGEVRNVIDQCDVFTIGFRTYGERLIVDTRTSAEEGPMVEVVEPVGTVEERFFWLGKRRPNLGVPERFTFFVWPHTVRFLTESGLADKLRERLAPDGSAAVDAALAQLEAIERKAVFDAITGRGYHTIWARSG